MIRHDPGDLGYQIYRSITLQPGKGSRGYSPSSEPTSFVDALKYFVKAAGGNVSAAARLMGAPRRSVRDWLAGVSTPGHDRRRAIAKSAQLSSRRQRLAPVREAKLRGNAADGIQVVGSYNYDPGERECSVGPYMAADSVDRLVDAYLRGDSPEQLRELFADLITNDPTGFYPETMARGPQDDHGWTVTRVHL